MKLLSQQVLGRRAKRGTSEGRGGGVGPNWVSEVGGGLLVEGFEMVLLFDREPAEAREVGVMCSGCWLGTPQSSECVGVTVGGSWEDRTEWFCSKAPGLRFKVPSAGKEGDDWR